MTKDEAIEAMLQGEKVTHRYFSHGEWVTLLDPIKNIYLFEDGVKVDAKMFWMERGDMEWQFDWEIFKD